MPVARLDTAGFKDDVLTSDVPVVVDFYADWCRPCHMVSASVEALAEEYSDHVRFVKVDIDAEPEVAEAYNISSIPAIVLFVRGNPKAWSIGAKPSHAIERELGLRKHARAEDAKAPPRRGALHGLSSLWRAT